VLLGLLTAAALLRFIGGERIRLAYLGRGALALALGCVLVLAADLAVAKRLAWTPGGFALSFGRMLQDGIVKKYLDAHCPAPDLKKLCAHKDELPDDADVWFWGSPLFDNLGRFAGLDQEMEKVAVRSLTEFPALQIETAAVATARQLIDVHTGEGVLPTIWHTYGIIRQYVPQLVPEMQAAHQQHGDIGFIGINRLHYPIALLSMVMLPLIVMLAWRGAVPAEIGELAAAVTLALLTNAFVCGALSNPHDRYGARIVWLAAFAVILAVVRKVQDKTGSQTEAATAAGLLGRLPELA
jgi:hypothetical protein